MSVHSHAKSIDRVNERSVEIERSPGPALVLAWPGPSYIAAERKEKPNHPRVCVMRFFPPISAPVFLASSMVRLCCVYF